MCDKAVDNHPSTIKHVPECYKTQYSCCTDRYIARKMSDEAVDDSQAALKFIPY